MSLRENAYDFLNESIRSAERVAPQFSVGPTVIVVGDIHAANSSIVRRWRTRLPSEKFASTSSIAPTSPWP
jgi:hypothetical protein